MAHARAGEAPGARAVAMVVAVHGPVLDDASCDRKAVLCLPGAKAVLAGVFMCLVPTRPERTERGGAERSRGRGVFPLPMGPAGRGRQNSASTRPLHAGPERA
jgi:hypothetical protein